jgi:hypothetical protein
VQFAELLLVLFVLELRSRPIALYRGVSVPI